MKKTLALLTIAGMFTASVRADVDIYIAGSTAFRANAYRSIRNLFGQGSNPNPSGVLVSQNPAHDASGQNIVTFSGRITNLFGGQTVTIRANYNGSIGGIQNLAGGIAMNFLSSSTPGDATTISHAPDLAFSDVFQGATDYKTPALSDALVGVQPFVYVKSQTGGSSITNITIQQLQTFMRGGVLPRSYFNGNPSDTNTLVYLVGRDITSGTRLTAEADDLLTTSPRLWAPDGSCNWTVSSGFTSGSGIVGVLNGSCGPAIGYLGISDAKNVNSGNNVLTYNGTLPFTGPIATPDFTPVYQGIYSLWSYEHLFSASSSGNAATYRTALATEINTDLATSTTAIQVGKMRVSRDADGGPITPN